ncbi:hypothetical protein [Paenibacillus sp. P22]|uniref:hypothetical protein n=1 Tax=Paenibacillus sp. P22 TaxID=483908 RepID=UPI00038FF7D4|nr:hypothetical protein [Paenibacillus sp. P22]CDN43083.1 hypothetical protein BN871_CK_00500 [Paenibacillus sp. P22]
MIPSERRLEDIERKVLRILVNYSKIRSTPLKMENLQKFTGKREGRLHHILGVLEQEKYVEIESRQPLRYRILKEFEAHELNWHRKSHDKGHEFSDAYRNQMELF